MLGQRRRRWPNIKQTFFQRLVFAGYCGQPVLTYHAYETLALLPCDHETPNQWRVSAGPASQTVGQHQTNTSSGPRVEGLINIKLYNSV